MKDKSGKSAEPYPGSIEPPPTQINDAAAKRRQRLISAPLLPLLWRMAVPSMIGMMVASVYSMTDTFFIGRLGFASLTAAVGIVFTFISVVHAIGFWFGYGSGNYISSQLGKNSPANAAQMATVAFNVAWMAGLLLAIPGLLFVKPLAVLLGAGARIALLEAVIPYLRITLISVPVMLISNTLYNQLRLQGSARDSMVGLLAGMFLNMVLDPLFILVFGMGVAGAAVASLIGQLSGALILFHLTHRNGNVPVCLSWQKPDFALVREMLAGGMPNFCRQGISSLSGIFMNLAAGRFGEPVIAGMTIALRLLSTGYALVIGFGQGFQPVCLVNHGAGNRQRIRQAFRLTLTTMTLFLIAVACVFACFGEGIARAFSSDASVVRTTTDFLHAFAFPLPFMGYYILIGMFMQNIRKFGRATLITTLEGLLMISLSLCLPLLSGYAGMIWCRPAASLCALVISLIIGTRTFKDEFQGGNRYGIHHSIS